MDRCLASAFFLASFSLFLLLIPSSSSPLVCVGVREAAGLKCGSDHKKTSVLSHLLLMSFSQCCLLFFSGFSSRVSHPFLLLFSRLLPLLQAHKMAWPFLEPVDTNDAPDYYRVIKEPMGKWQKCVKPRCFSAAVSSKSLHPLLLMLFLTCSGSLLGVFK